MPNYGRQSSASQQWWDQYNLGLMGVYTGSTASQFGMQHRRAHTWEKPAPVIVSKKTSAPAPVHYVPAVPAATAKSDGKLLQHVGGGLIFLFGFDLLCHAVLADPSCLISFALIGGAVALCSRIYRRLQRSLQSAA
jgi:hypothetical protein